MKSALRISGIYLVIGMLWIIFSDNLVQFISQDRSGLFQLQTYKGFFYVGATALLLYYMVRRLVRKQQKELERRIEKENELVQVIQENEQFRHLFEQTSSGMIITDPKQVDNPIKFVNAGFEKITGYKSEEVIGKNPRFLHGSVTKDKAKEKIKHAVNENKPIQIEIKNYRKDGTAFWNELKISPIFDKHNKLQYYTGIQNDITEKMNQTVLIENQLEFVRSMLASGNPADTFTQFPQLIEQHLGMPCTLVQFDYKNQTYNLFASSTVPSIFKESLRNYSLGKIENKDFHLFTKETLFVKNIYKDNRFEPFWEIAREVDYQSLWSTPLKSNEGEVLGLFTVYAGPTDRIDNSVLRNLNSYSSTFGLALQNVQYNNQLLQSERKYRLIGKNSSDMVCLLDENLNASYMSPSHVQFFGEHFTFSTIKKALSKESLRHFNSFIDMLKIKKEQEMIELEIRDTHDKWHWLEMKGNQFHDEEEQQTKILLVARDITERKAFEDRLNRLIHYDTLTNLPNQYYFRQTLMQKIKDHSNFALLLFEFDQMKEIQSLYGEETEVFVLSQLPEKIYQTLPVSMIARTGESEFSLLIDDLYDIDKLQSYVKDLLSVLEQPWQHNNQEFVATISVGIALYEEQTVDTLRLQAELALQTARKTGKHRYHIYVDEIHKGVKASIVIQNELYHALERQQFKMFYQPQVNLQQIQVDGVEALIRWKHPNLGTISPGEFIKIAEDTGWIVPISEWIIRQVCLDTVSWGQQGINRNTAINISYRHMEEVGFVDTVKEILIETGCPPERLTFEITESMLMKDLSLSFNVLIELKALGIHISVDDFGVGYSSLSYLKKFPIDSLKIDRAFVTNIHEDANDYAIVQAIMEMTRALGLKVIAEGTELEEHIQILQKLGCHHFQGYWFSKPVDNDNLQASIDRIYQEKLHIFSK